MKNRLASIQRNLISYQILFFTDEEEFTNWWTGEWNEYYNEDPIVPLEDPVVTYVTLYVDDPGMLKEVEDEIRGIDDKIDWEYYNFEYYDKDYKAIAKPLLLMVKTVNCINDYHGRGARL